MRFALKELHREGFFAALVRWWRFAVAAFTTG